MAKKKRVVKILPCEHRQGNICTLDPIPLGCWTYEPFALVPCPALPVLTYEEYMKYCDGWDYGETIEDYHRWLNRATRYRRPQLYLVKQAGEV